MRINILGVNAYHADASACVIKDWILDFAIEEERICRVKHWAGFPARSIESCLEHANLGLADIDVIALNSNPYVNLKKKIFYVLKNQHSLKFIKSRMRNTVSRLGAVEDFSRHFPGANVKSRIRKIEHHHAHLASAYYASGFTNACVFSIDGFGDFSSAAWGVAENNQINIQDFVHYPHSLGIFYQAITQFLGFKNYGDEYKVMGMAAYGKPVYKNLLEDVCHIDNAGKYQLDLDYFVHHTSDSTYSWQDGQPQCSDFYNQRMENLLGPPRLTDQPIEQRHKDIACSAQAVYEQVFLDLCNRLYDKTRCPDLALAGGCAMNSLANGHINRKTPFKNVYIQAAAGDAGGAVGAANVVAMELGASRENLVMEHAYWGPEYSRQQLHQCINQYSQDLSKAKCTIDELPKSEELYTRVSNAITRGRVIGWFQGRMEWGPRALGNRSILADPRRPDIQEILNLKIKRRESFRPFAPSILIDQLDDWFEQNSNVPFMGQVFMIRPEKRELIPAVTHVDGSGRLQTVSRDVNPKYYELISCFFRQTGVPMLLNTSFNENEPIVCHPDQAIECFLRTRMDILVLGNFYISRN